jgi:glycerate 2-kinase
MFTAAFSRFSRSRAVVAAPAACEAASFDDVEVVRTGHPWPDAGSVHAATRALDLAAGAASSGGLLLLLSGGASAMLAAPAAGLTLFDKIEASRALMASGAAIDELNCVRKHLSRIKGGRLGAAAGRTITLALSDVHGPVADDPTVIGSGPTVPDPTSYGDALAVIRSRTAAVPPAVVEHLERGARGGCEETIKPGDPRLGSSQYHVVGNRHTAVAGARQEAERRGYRVVVIEEATTGEAREAARRWVHHASSAGRQSAAPTCVIGSGETTVTVRGDGLGGRNQEFVLGAIAELASLGRSLGRRVLLASAGTDGVDGPTDAAGALADETTLSRAQALRLDPAVTLARNDAHHFFEPLGDLISWGPTGTNVGDLHVLLVR